MHGILLNRTLMHGSRLPGVLYMVIEITGSCAWQHTQQALMHSSILTGLLCMTAYTYLLGFCTWQILTRLFCMLYTY